jgi:predicted HicB family RNase H-like nuclease
MSKKRTSLKDKLNQTNEKAVEKAVEILGNENEKSVETLKERERKKMEYNKNYAKKTATLKVDKEYHEKAKSNAKKRFMPLKSYIEYLINEDSKNFPTEY